MRDRFLSNLVTAVEDPHDRITVVLALRADFYGLPLAHPAFGARLGAGVVNVTDLTAEELEAAALRPAEQVGVSFEPALLGQLISDVGSQPGALPLFQYALTELFDRRVGDTLMASTYRSMGGSKGRSSGGRPTCTSNSTPMNKRPPASCSCGSSPLPTATSAAAEGWRRARSCRSTSTPWPCTT